MIVLRSLVMAFSLFTVIPMPQVDWSERNMRYLMAAFPAVGLLIGALVWGWWHLCGMLGFASLMRAAGVTLIPVALTGGIHLDGFADVMDALSSHAEPERKRQIMKDPHVGAFAIMGVCCYLIAYLALASEVDEEHLLALACVPILSRCLSSYATVSFRKASKTGMLADEGTTVGAPAIRLVVLGIYMAVGALLVACDGAVGVLVVMAAVVVLLYVKRIAEREFGGMGGDLAGLFLQLAELVMLAVIAVVGRLV